MKSLLTVAALTALFSGGAQADSAYKSEEIMKISRVCTVKSLGAHASRLELAVGDTVKITTTTNRNYNTPMIIRGANSASVPNKAKSVIGTSGRFSYDSSSPVGNVFEILGGPMNILVKEASPNVTNGVFKSVMYIQTSSFKVAELSCKNIE